MIICCYFFGTCVIGVCDDAEPELGVCGFSGPDAVAVLITAPTPDPTPVITPTKRLRMVSGNDVKKSKKTIAIITSMAIIDPRSKPEDADASVFAVTVFARSVTSVI